MKELFRKALKLPAFGLALLPALLVRVLRPFVLIRFRRLVSTRIGHFAVNTEIYLCERDAGMHGNRTMDIFYHDSPISNQQLRNMWNRALTVIALARWVDSVSRRLPGSEKHIVPWRSRQGRDIHGLLARTAPHLRFTHQEERRGRAALETFGVPEEAPFVCFHARDSAYLESVLADSDWRYHDYRDSTIQNNLLAAEELARRGYLAIRLGAVVRVALETNNPKIIDYAANGSRSDFMDIYLGAKCRFFIGDTAGVYAIPAIFRKPVAFVNYVPLGTVHTWNPYDLSIPKKMWLKGQRRFMTFREILESGVGWFTLAKGYEDMGIDLVENSPEEIVALAVEMDERLKGTWQTTEEDEQLQARFWSMFKLNEYHGVFASRIGSSFLRENLELLG